MTSAIHKLHPQAVSILIAFSFGSKHQLFTDETHAGISLCEAKQVFRPSLTVSIHDVLCLSTTDLTFDRIISMRGSELGSQRFINGVMKVVIKNAAQKHVAAASVHQATNVRKGGKRAKSSHKQGAIRVTHRQRGIICKILKAKCI